MKRRLLRYLAPLVVVALIALTIVGNIGSGHLLSPSRRTLQQYHREILSSPRDFGIVVQDFNANDGTPCLLVEPTNRPGKARKGRTVRKLLASNGCAPPPWGRVRGTVVLLHGHVGRKEDHLPITERFCAAGFRCLLPDLPGHGDNPSRIASFGFHEAALVEQLLDDAAARFGFDPAPACLFGVSQGGSIALLTAARGGHRWAAVAAVATFASLDQMLHRACRQTAGPFAPLAATSCGLGVRLRAGFFPSEVQPAEAAKRIKIPSLIIHGARDTFIPPADGQAIFDAIPHSAKHLRIVPDGSHGNVLARGSHPLYAEICRFFIAATETAAGS